MMNEKDESEFDQDQVPERVLMPPLLSLGVEQTQLGDPPPEDARSHDPPGKPGENAVILFEGANLPGSTVDERQHLLAAMAYMKKLEAFARCMYHWKRLEDEYRLGPFNRSDEPD
ncbi:hypothetical protein G9444_6835 (plasmid) [Rhodococcus erythropolis]|uniref:Uncharacterized protein n=1 Tax=Rhodococcus erythropolis TaxID=1833 RepID=A0A6G9D4J5_RHOER|nr:hypothetical protein [Rhodococcus erythropolis]QIP44078.1 hypothetical protein G9444_6835 [Rhodococcus erythropolis]REK78061.1 hypothetical protein DVG80_32665 [Rhodococcus erythropolis]